MDTRTLELGIQSVRNGQLEEGARLIRIGLKEDIPNEVRAVGYLWLAETTTDYSQKLDYYRQAQQYDPASEDISRRISALLASQLPPSTNAPLRSAPLSEASQMPPPPTQRTTTQPLPAVGGLPDLFNGQPPLDIPTPQHAVGVGGGPNGMGAGFFIHNQGIVATTRHVVGMNAQLDIVLNTGQSVRGFVVRSYPTFDLAFVRVNAWVRQLSPFSTSPIVVDNTPLVIVDYRGQSIRTTRRVTRQETAAHWFPTTVEKLQDAGGDPVFDNQGLLVGLMTTNAFRTNKLLYGLHISAIVNLLNQYMAEVAQAGGAPTYCPGCGHASRAPLFGGFYCENCGTTLPQFSQMQRFPQMNPNMALLYGETHPPCSRCGARVGFYKNKCLRCEVVS